MRILRDIRNITCLFLLIFDLSLASSRAETPSVEIGALYPLSGDSSQFGSWFQRGAELGAAKINAEGGIAKRNLAVIYEDSAGNAASAVSGFKTLRNRGIEFISTSMSSVALAIKPLAQQEQVIQMDVSSTAPSLSTTNGFVFRTSVLATQLAKAEALIMSEKFNVRELACIYIDNDFGQAMFNVLKTELPGKIAGVETFRPDERDFRSLLTRLKVTKPRHVWLAASGIPSGILISEARQLGLDSQFFSDVYSIENPDFLKVSNGGGNGTIYFAPLFDMNSTSVAVKEFVGAYRAKFHEDPTIASAQAFDGIISLGLAMQQCGELTTCCVRDALRTLSFEGASGLIKFDQDGNVSKTIQVKTIVNGKFVAL